MLLRSLPQTALLLLAPALVAVPSRLCGESTLGIRTGGWVRAVPASAEVTAAYLVLENRGTAIETLVGAASPACQEVELHETVQEGAKMRMVRVERMEVPAGGTLELRPGGAHLMLIGLRAPLEEGSKVPITLRFASGTVLEVELSVLRAAPASPAHCHDP